MQLSTYSDYAKLLRQNIDLLKRDFHVSEIGIFGSYVRGEQDEQSDLDILVRYNITPGIFKWLELEELLSQLTGQKVDLVTEGSMKPKIREQVRKEVVWI